MLNKLLSIAAGVIVIGVFAAAGGLYRAHRESEQMIADRIVSATPVTIDLRPSAYADLPDPVRRYFDFAFNGQESITLRGVEWEQSGDFLLPVVGPFSADGRQVSHPIQPVYAFIGWFWRYGLPLIESRDAYFVGSHDMRAKLFGWMKVMQTDYENESQINSLHSYLLLRYYGQAPLMPWALLPNDFAAWEPNDDQSAYLTITLDDLAGRYLVSFGARGEILSMNGDRLLVEGNELMQREEGTKSNYAEINGFMVPTHLEYSWYNEDDALISHFDSRITLLRLLP